MSATKYRIFLVFCLWTTANALMEPEDLPPSLRQCFEMKTKYTNVKDVPSEDICLTCITNFLWTEGKHKHCVAYNRTQNNDRWIAEALDEVVTDPNGRFKRSYRQRKRRKEYRMLTDKERKDFHLALNKMKQDTSIYPNRYDAFVEFHGRQAGRSAHRGPTFLGWHRILLILFEHQLGLQVPGVSLPYLDTTLDSSISGNAQNSILWTEEFLGNGNGEVTTGPFKYWTSRWNETNYKLVRNIGSTGRLFTKSSILNILSKRYTHEITEPSYNPHSSLEGLHDRVHFWVGGNMFNLQTAPMDPVFFMHHAFVDLIWELFRQQQKTYYKIDPGKDYPKTTDPLFHPTREMDGIPPPKGWNKFRNIDGYSSIWTDRFYFYDPPPTCNKFTLDCRSKWLECDPKRLVCVSKTEQAMAFQYPTFNAFDPWDFWKNRGKRDIREQLFSDTAPQFPTQISFEKIKLTVPKENILGSPVQNTFIIDCKKPDVKSYVFLPVKIIHVRPKEVKVSAHVVEDGVTKDNDLYNESNYNSLKTLIKPGSPGSYSNCLEDQSGAFRVSLTSFGLSYNGWFEDYVVVDNRLPISSHVGYLGVQKPVNDQDVTAFLTATDTCGRMCKPRCLKKKNDGSQVYVPCSGVVKMTDKTPLMYGESYGDAVRSVWDFSDPNIPANFEKDIFMVFYCDYSDSWPWEN